MTHFSLLNLYVYFSVVWLLDNSLVTIIDMSISITRLINATMNISGVGTICSSRKRKCHKMALPFSFSIIISFI